MDIGFLAKGALYIIIVVFALAILLIAAGLIAVRDIYFDLKRSAKRSLIAALPSKEVCPKHSGIIP